jgi:gliding motility-associated-like protein
VQAVNAGVYTVNITLPNGLSGSGSTTVSVGNGLDVDAGPDITIQLGQDAQLSVTGGVSWQWFPTNFLSFPNISNPIVQNPPLGEFTYWVDAIGLDGCTGSDTVVVTVVEELPPVSPDELVVYDLFTPNGDGMNDTWVVEGIQRLQNYQLTVFNRGGAEIYSTTNYQNDWTGTYRGKELPEGTYWYIITAGDDVIKGPVTIIR